MGGHTRPRAGAGDRRTRRSSPRPEVPQRTALSDAVRPREEDPLTDVLASVGDHLFVSRTSRFEIETAIDWLARVSPLDNTVWWDEFVESGYTVAPPLTYPPFDLPSCATSSTR